MNNAIFYFFYNFAHKSVILDWLVVFTAIYFPFVVAFLAFLYLLFYRKSVKEFFIVFVTAGAAGLISKLLKILIHTSRPTLVLQNISTLFTKTSYAFPSDHATFFMALALSMFFINKKAGYVFFIFALLIGIARIMAGVHFPVDILGGFILGGIVSCLIAFFVKNV